MDRWDKRRRPGGRSVARDERPRGYGGRLNIRPPYQREFIYKEKERNEVIHTVRKNFPLNTMYWVKAANDDFELMDGQQRTINKKGIYEYLLTGNEKTLSLRAFDEKTKQKSYARQNGICPICKKHFTIGEMEADHILPWSKGGKTAFDNCQMLCKMDNRTKSGK